MKGRSRKKLVLTMLGATAVLTATAVAHVWTHLQVIEYGYQISKATRLRDELLEQNRRLRVDLAMLKDPARVAKIAADKFGLGPTEPSQLRRLRVRGNESLIGRDEAQPLVVSRRVPASELVLADRFAGRAVINDVERAEIGEAGRRTR